ncbi:DUF952 domain-containing protein [Sneathiella chungangensis]|uniref:DUF952 domain-containing protein n=1 Tax=Sneathiella chungangensis TaxID=1418234 RepID=A0A845MIT9_9PROT|nr:DUF952 domain-containing protein [Sneathiella chungangensis]MZR23330.1 DUF952 domain-containing protein [Sneathiella chungangensis]
MTTIYHMADKREWMHALETGAYHGTAADKADGFIHFSTRETVVGSAAKHRAGVKNLLLISVDAGPLGAALKWEPARGGILFPHLYGPLDPALVRDAVELPLGPENLHIFPRLE